MKTKIFVLFILFVFFTCSTTNVVLTGTWKNKLGSIMKLHARDNILKGIYYTAVSRNGTMLKSSLIGSYNEIEGNKSGTIAFNVQWRNSVTAWSGKFRDNTINTIWVLVSFGKPEWDSYSVNKDFFMKTK